MDARSYWNLRTHLKDHKCESCGKTFSQADTLEKHIHAIHKHHKDHSVLPVSISVEKNVPALEETQKLGSFKETLISKKDPLMLRNSENIDVVDFSICNCKDEDQSISTHYCEECIEGFCSSCVQAHQRFKVTRIHTLQRITYYCKCKEERLAAVKYCKDCSQAFCSECIVAHERLIITRTHILKAI